MTVYIWKKNLDMACFFFLCLQQEQRLGETGGALAEVKFEKHVTKHIALDLQKLEK